MVLILQGAEVCYLKALHQRCHGTVLHLFRQSIPLAVFATPASTLRLFMRSPAHELASGTHIHPYAPPSVEHTDNRIHLWAGRSHPADGHVYAFRRRAARRH